MSDKNTTFILCPGLCNKAEAANKTVGTNRYIVFPYKHRSGFKGAFGLLDHIALLKDMHALRQDGIPIARPNRAQRLVNLIRELSVDASVSKIVLLGISHGCLIMFCALYTLSASCNENRENLLDKVHFYALSSPELLPVKKISAMIHTFVQVYHIGDPFFFPVDNSLYFRIVRKAALANVVRFLKRHHGITEDVYDECNKAHILALRPGHGDGHGFLGLFEKVIKRGHVDTFSLFEGLCGDAANAKTM